MANQSQLRYAIAPVVLNSEGNRMHIRNHFKMSAVDNKTILATAILAFVLSACGKTESKIFTADRVKIVEEKQKADANFHLQTKSGATASSESATSFPVTVQAMPAPTSAKM